MGLCVFFIYTEASQNYYWQWARVWRYIGVFTDEGFKAGVLLDGLWVSLYIIALGLVLSLLIGTFLAFARLSASPVAVFFAKHLISLIRNTPLLIQLFLFYFVVAPVFSWSPFVTAVVCLSLFEGVYFAENFRAGIISLPKAQWEAAFSLGMSMPMTVRLVIFPQIIRIIMPALTGQVISLIKDSALVSVIAVTDLTMRARELISETYLSFEVWIVVASFYFILTIPINVLAFFIARKQN